MLRLTVDTPTKLSAAIQLRVAQFASHSVVRPSEHLADTVVRTAALTVAVASGPDYAFEPGLPAALAALSGRQRLAVVLVHGYRYTLREVAELTGLRQTTVQNHLTRGLARLRSKLGVTDAG
jgi:DNA-directed RNA polymerase specialized sigma24 family protein